MTQEDVKYVEWCISNDIHRFYTWTKWLKVRSEVLADDKYECQDCRKKGIYVRATTVHHENYVKKHPELALEKDYEYCGIRRRNLTSLCHDCHEARHGYRKRHYSKPVTEEKW